MITDLLLLIFWLIPRAVITLLPTGNTLPDSVATAINYVSVQARTMNEFFPVGTLTSALVLVLLIESIFLGIKLILFVIGLARGHRSTNK